MKFTSAKGIKPRSKKIFLFNRAWRTAAKGSAKFGGTKREYFSQSLKIEWAIMKNETQEEIELAKSEKIAAAKKIKIAEKKEKTRELNKNAPKRTLVTWGKYQVGDTLGSYMITGLGRDFEPNVDMFSMGITPDTDLVQYAYFN